MNRIVIDSALRSKLDNLPAAVELCDETGRVVGRFTPVPDSARYSPLEPQVSEEELQRRVDAGGGRTLAEIFTDWKN